MVIFCIYLGILGFLLALASTILLILWAIKKERFEDSESKPGAIFPKPFKIAMNLACIMMYISLVLALRLNADISTEVEILLFLVPVLITMAVESKIYEKLKKKTSL